MTRGDREMTDDDIVKIRLLLQTLDYLSYGIEAVYRRDPSSDLLDGLRTLRAEVIEEVRPLIDAYDASIEEVAK